MSAEFSHEPSAPVLVLGIGNPLLADDGVGPVLLERLRDSYADDPRVELVDGGTQGLALVRLLQGRHALLLLDAVQRGARAGHVHVVYGAERIAQQRGFGVHGSNASELLAVAGLVDALPATVELVGIEPAEVHLRYGLSLPVARAVPRAAARARARLAELLAREDQLACTS